VALTAMVVVHRDAERCDAVRSYLAEHAPTATVAHAAATDRKRGHAINVAIDALTADADSYGFFCILDDDDIYYPGFAERMLTALRQGAHVAYCASNAREPWLPAERGHSPLPAPALLAGNFIPTNAVAVRTDALLATGCRMREDLEYLEDWEFLLQLLGQGARFTPVYETLSEYRLIGDGNRTIKANQWLWDSCARDVAVQAKGVARAVGPYGLARAVLAFDFARRPPLTDRERQLLDMTAASLADLDSGERRDVAG
jgi:glycosyltransferase involved in cell wall biosynthesis